MTQLPKHLFGIVDNDSIPFEGKKDSTDYNEEMETYEARLIRTGYQKYGSSRKMAEYLSISQTKANNLIRKYIDD